MSLSLEQIREAFAIFDADGSGFIDAKEMQLAMQALGFGLQPMEEVERMIKSIDLDQNGLVDMEEFGQMMRSKEITKDSAEDIHRAFKLFDQDNKGRVSLHNLRNIARSLGETIPDDVLQQMIDEADSNKDGMIDFEEWRKMMEYMMQHERSLAEKKSGDKRRKDLEPAKSGAK
eukprot:TRINITY_DN93289_c0_g1_i1.p1 TRINITY_DN93289_c0_g1~~TRINITY_DN93289_c0_g1_i1.p1  ORF type:complete len:174 (+),score=46.09 TRINITY_DN93289_c0_g1_i1:33-554(+)